MSKVQNSNHAKNELRKIINFITQNRLPISSDAVSSVTSLIETTIGVLSMHENEYIQAKPRYLEVVK